MNTIERMEGWRLTYISQSSRRLEEHMGEQKKENPILLSLRKSLTP